MRRKVLIFLLAAAIFTIIMVSLIVKGIIVINTPSTEDYPVRGVDVSHYQGNVNFQRLAEQGMQFAFIKATEGSSSLDECFEFNLAAVQNANLRPGFYHFFSYDSAGIAQAENFIAHVPVVPGMLPPVIDVEFYGDKNVHPPKHEQVELELRQMVDVLEQVYGVKPILYCTQRAYRLYVKNAFDDCDLWIRNVYTRPFVDRKWIFWQYTDRAVLEGYDGIEPCIDVNVFHGTQAEFDSYPSAQKAF